MIGVSLSPKYLLNGSGINEKPDVLLPRLYRLGVRSVELRDAKPGTDPQCVYDCAELLWNNNFRVSVHCRVSSLETAVSDVFDTLSLTLKHLRQESLTVTIHPIVEDNAEILRRLSDHATKNKLPVMIALENNRKLPDGTEGDSTAFVLKAVEDADRSNVGICFDMGHYFYYVKKNYPDKLDMLPSAEFFKRVIHTHIHALKGLNTHFPLDQFELPLERILLIQSVCYYGVLNIELSFSRFSELREPVDALVGSIKALKESMPERARIYDELRSNYDRQFLDALSIFNNKKDGTHMALTQCASYLFCTNGLSWAMDLSFLNVMWKLTRTPYYVANLLKDLRLIVVTHQHSDHFEKKTVRALSEIKSLYWVIPDFLVERALEYGINRDNMLVAKEGKYIQFENLNILPFSGRHYRRGTKSGVKCMGYHISAKGSPSMVFPGDVRDYGTYDLPALPNADYCFAHVWLGDGVEFDDVFPMAEDFARFMLYFSEKNILLSHLYNSERKLGYMWTVRHAEIVSEAIHRISPDTKTYIPRIGQIIPLTD